MPDPPRSSSEVVRFGTFEVDVRSGEVRKAGVRIALQDQPLRVLTRLIQRPGEVVTREELQRELWPDNTFLDFEHGLNAAIKRLRDALGDSAESPRFVETLPRRGYRFIAPVVDGVTSAAASPQPEIQPRSTLTMWKAVVVVLALGTIAARRATTCGRPPARGAGPGLEIRAPYPPDAPVRVPARVPAVPGAGATQGLTLPPPECDSLRPTALFLLTIKIAKRIEQVSRGVFKVNPGSLLIAFRRLERHGCLKGEWRATENNRRARFYQLTAAGRKHLESTTREWRRRSAAIARLLEG